MAPPRTVTDDQRKYNQTRLLRINRWRKRGLLLPEGYTDWKDFHDRGYLGATTCAGPGDGSKCEVVFGDPGPRGDYGGRDMEHDHSTGLFRGVCCRRCNIQRRFTLDGEPLLTEQEKDRRQSYARNKLLDEVVAEMLAEIAAETIAELSPVPQEGP